MEEIGEINSLNLSNQNLAFLDSNKDFDIKDLKKVYFLNLRMNFLSEFGGIAKLESLIHLDISNNFLKKWTLIVSLRGIGRLKKLKFLFCKENGLEDCSDLMNPELELLDLQKNQLSDSEQVLKVVANLHKLRQRDLRDNCFVEESELMTSILSASVGLENYNASTIEQLRKTVEGESKE